MKTSTYTQDIGKGLVDKMQELQDNTNTEELLEGVLSVDTEIVKKILLSWGGPEDGFKLYFDDHKNLLRGVYYRADWGEYKEISLSDDEAQLIYNLYLGGYIE